MHPSPATNTRLALAIAGVLASAATLAQSAAPAASGAAAGTLEEIVVTSERRSERLLDVPMSIEAFGQEKLDQEGLRNVDDLARVAPGITFLRNGAGSSGNYNDEGSDISIRGIDSAAGASTVGIYLDDTPIQTRHLNFGTVNAFPALFDLDRVEVLKGPQGTLFGAGSEGGTIRFITPEASLNGYTGYTRAEYGSIAGGGENYEAGAAIGGPIIDGVLGFRISASFREDGGWVDRVNYIAPPFTTPTVATPYGPSPVTLYSGTPTVTNTTEKNANWHDTQTFRAALKWQPTDNLTVDPSLYAQTLHINDTASYWLNISDPSSDSYLTGNKQRNPSTDPFWLAALKVTWNQPWATLTSNTSYFSRAQHSTSDYTQWFNSAFLYTQYPPADVTSAFFTDHQNNFNQEFRLNSTDAQSALQWSAGLFYTHTYEDSTEYVTSPIGGAGLPGNLTYLQPRFSMLDKQLAVFGEVNWKFTDTLKLTVGLRYSDLKFDGVVQEIEQGYFGSLNVNTPSSGESKPLTPRFVLNYQPDADSLYYASASKGFRPGGINTQLPANCFDGTNTNPATAAQPFSSDSLWNYELGTKDSFLQHRLSVSGSVYYLKWSNIQQFVYLACGLGFDYNLGEATGRGGDIEVNWKPSDAVTLGVTAAYTSTYFNEPVTLPGGTDQLVASGDHLPASPWNLDFNAEYVWQDMSRKPYVRADYQYATAQNSLVPYQDVQNAPNSDTTQPGLPTIRILNLRAGLRFDGFDLSVFATNALDYHSPLFVSRDLATSTVNGWGANFDNNYFGRGYAPRTIGLTATYKF